MSGTLPEVTQEREGWSKVPHWLLREVNPTCVVVYAHMASYAWLPDGARPPVSRIAKELDMSVRTVQRALGDLADHGAIEVTERWSEVGQQMPSRYHLRLTKKEGAKSDTLQGTTSNHQGDKSDTLPLGGDTDDTPGGDTSVTGGVTLVSPEQEQQEQDPRKMAREAARARSDALFAEFWTVYPRHEKKQLAKRKWDTLVLTKGVDPLDILAGARVYARANAAQKPEYIAHPTSWLNAGRWEDEVVTKGSPAPTPPPALPVVLNDSREPDWITAAPQPRQPTPPVPSNVRSIR